MVRQRFKPFKKAKEAKDFWDNAQEPQEGLVPLFNSPFYATPDEPADPTDCNRYPDSPYCGGNPFTIKFVPSIEVSIVRDECNLGIQFDGSFGFIKVPPVQIVYRNPACTPSPPPPEEPRRSPEKTPLTVPPADCLSPLYIVFRKKYHRYGHGGARYVQNPPFFTENGASWSFNTLDITILKVQYPIQFESGVGAIIDYHAKYSSTTGDENGLSTGLPLDAFEGSGQVKVYPDAVGVEPGLSARYNGFLIHAGTMDGLIFIGIGEYPVSSSYLTYYPSFYERVEGTNIQYQYTDASGYLRPITVTTPLTTFTMTSLEGSCVDTFYGKQCAYEVPYLRIVEDSYVSLAFCGNWQLPSVSPPPLPPPPMSCCPKVEQNDQLLRLILKRIGEPKEVTIFDEDLSRKGAQKSKKKPKSLNDFLKLAVERTEIVSRIVGIENFPITVPETMIEPHKEGIFAKVFGFIDGTKKRKINTIAELITWMSEQDSAVLGQFHQVLEFDTGEKDKKGKSVMSTVVLPNVAETLKEITLLVAQMAKQNNVQTELLFKMAVEIVAARTAAHKASLIAADIQDYLDYPTQTITGTIPTSVKFPYVVQDNKGNFQVTEINEDPKEFLKNGSVSFVYDDWTGDNSLKDNIMDLLQMAAMVRAMMYQRTDK